MLIFLPNDIKNCIMITDLTMDVFIIMLMESPGLDPRITLSSKGAVIIGRSGNLKETDFKECSDISCVHHSLCVCYLKGQKLV